MILFINQKVCYVIIPAIHEYIYHHEVSKAVYTFVSQTEMRIKVVFTRKEYTS